MAGTTVSFRRIDVLEAASFPESVETVPLFGFWHEPPEDVATLSNEADMDTLEKQGYVFTHRDARILKTAKEGTAPLLLYKSGDGKKCLTVSTEAGKKTARDEGYKLVGVQGW